MFILIRALNGSIGPAGKNTTSIITDSYDEAFVKMRDLIDGDGGGECSYEFRNGYSDANGVLYGYEIFEV